MPEKTRPHDWPSPTEFIEEARKHGTGLLGPQAKVMPYVGIAGFTDPHFVRSIAGDLYTMNPYGIPETGGRRLAVGVLASWKTLCGEPAGDPERYPRIEDVRALLDAAVEPIRHRSLALGQTDDDGRMLEIKDRCLRLIHYNSKEPNLVAQVDSLCAIAGPNLDGFQFNIAWPDDDEVRSLAMDYPALRFILQVNREMFSNVARNPKWLAHDIGKRYVPAITDILFDMSGGTGTAIDMAEAASVLDALYGEFGGAAKGGIGIGIAGGLDYKNVHGLKPLFDRWPDLSIDAEGRIRDSYVDWDTKKTVTFLNENAREYARRAIALAREVHKTETTP